MFDPDDLIVPKTTIPKLKLGQLIQDKDFPQEMGMIVAIDYASAVCPYKVYCFGPPINYRRQKIEQLGASDKGVMCYWFTREYIEEECVVIDKEEAA